MQEMSEIYFAFAVYLTAYLIWKSRILFELCIRENKIIYHFSTFLFGRHYTYKVHQSKCTNLLLPLKMARSRCHNVKSRPLFDLEITLLTWLCLKAKKQAMPAIYCCSFILIYVYILKIYARKKIMLCVSMAAVEK
jgi:hypothetical protein